MNGVHNPIFKYVIGGPWEKSMHESVYLPLHFLTCKLHNPFRVEVSK